MKTGMSLFGMEMWFGNDARPTIEKVRIADSIGVDQVLMGEHVVMGPNTASYPYGPFPQTFDVVRMEPMCFLPLLAGVTKNIRLVPSVLLSVLRPAALVAKQIATLDYLSNGRAHIAFGYGWQKEELEACGVAWKDKFDLMSEQIRACKKLWTEGPTSFHGKFINFDNITCFPHPVQKPLPISFGLAPTDRNIGLMAELSDGWQPIEADLQKLAEPIRKLKAARKARGRDPEDVEIRITLLPVEGANGQPDLDASLARLPEYAAAGVTTINFMPSFFTNDPQDFTRVVEKIERAVKG